MVFRDKTFCASPNCKNDCGRKMTDEERQQLAKLPDELQLVSQGYFCGQPGDKHDSAKCGEFY